MKLSFSIPKSKSTSTSNRPNAVPTEEPRSTSVHSQQFVTEFDPTRPLNSEPNLIIAPISNSEYTKRFKPSLPLPTAADDPNLEFSSENQFVLDTNNAADPSGLPYGLFVRSDKEKEGKEEKGAGRERVERVDDLKRFKDDIHNLPEDRGQDEFLDIAVEEFGAAILRGYGWSEGKGLGGNKNKEDTKIVQFEKRGGTYGLGFNPSASDPKKKKGGDWTLPGENGNKGNSESKDLERGRSSNGSRREERDGSSSRRNGKDVERERDDSSRRNGKDVERERVRDDRRRNEKVVERERTTSSRSKEEEREREKSSSKRRTDDDRNKERERVSISSSSSKKETKQVRWLTSHIRVRIISKDLKRGKYYLKKGEILDVVGPTTCDISMDGTRELVQGVEQEMLETALPKKGGSVLVLYGKSKGILGNLMDKDLDEETAIVRDADSHEMINVKLEQIAEFVGDPSLLDY